MNLQQNIFGEELFTGTAAAEVSSILERYPAAAENPGMFYWLLACDRCPWIAQLDPKRQMELRDAFYGIESARRRRQEYRASNAKQ